MTKSIPNAKAFLLVVKLVLTQGPARAHSYRTCSLADQLVTVVSQTPGRAGLITASILRVTQAVWRPERLPAGACSHFTQSLYRGTVGLGSGVGTAIKDAVADPSQPLRIRAQDPEFPVGTRWSFGPPGLLLGGGKGQGGVVCGAAWAQD